MFEWQTIVAMGALALSAFVVFSRAIEKSLTIREHEEFKKSVGETNRIRDQQLIEAKKHIEDRVVIREFLDWCAQFRRDVDRLDNAIRVLDQAKPTTGELEAASEAILKRLSLVEDFFKLRIEREK